MPAPGKTNNHASLALTLASVEVSQSAGGVTCLFVRYSLCKQSGLLFLEEVDVCLLSPGFDHVPGFIGSV